MNEVMLKMSTKEEYARKATNVSWKCQILQQNYQRTMYIFILSWGLRTYTKIVKEVSNFWYFIKPQYV